MILHRCCYYHYIASNQNSPLKYIAGRLTHSIQSESLIEIIKQTTALKYTLNTFKIIGACAIRMVFRILRAKV